MMDTLTMSPEAAVHPANDSGPQEDVGDTGRPATPPPGTGVTLEQVNQKMSQENGGEPFFTLRGQDFMAPKLIRLWADMLFSLSQADTPANTRRRAKAHEAFLVADAMDAWPKKKIPD